METLNHLLFLSCMCLDKSTNMYHTLMKGMIQKELRIIHRAFDFRCITKKNQ